MRIAVNTARILVGALFIFSGLVKAIDPLGLSYKMQEFFEVWANDGFMKGLMLWLNGHALLFSVIMITLEVVLGFALLVGWKSRITTWLLLLLTVFFTFLTAFVLFTGKIRACGCFGDCIPLTPVQTFTKDIILLLLIIFILIGRKYIQPIFKKPLFSWIAMLLVTAGTCFLQYYVLGHLPLKDCLPFKVGNDILELRKMPKDAVADKFDYIFIYEKNGEKKEFKVDALPDSSWTYADRKQILVSKGKNNIPLINDFSLKTDAGVDTTEAILSQPREYYLYFLKDPERYPEEMGEYYKLLKKSARENTPVYIVTSNNFQARERFWNMYAVDGRMYDPPVFTCDATAMKTAARNNVTLYKMKGPVVQAKWGGEQIEEAVK